VPRTSIRPEDGRTHLVGRRRAHSAPHQQRAADQHQTRIDRKTDGPTLSAGDARIPPRISSVPRTRGSSWSSSISTRSPLDSTASCGAGGNASCGACLLVCLAERPAWPLGLGNAPRSKTAGRRCGSVYLDGRRPDLGQRREGRRYRRQLQAGRRRRRTQVEQRRRTLDRDRQT
jgi:hypothetical protein